MTTPAAIYRQDMRYGVRLFGTPETVAMLLGTPVASLLMDDLEAYYALVMDHDPRCLAPAEYRSQREPAT